MKKYFMAVFAAFLCISVNAFEPSSAKDLFINYLGNNSEVKNLVINAQKTQLSYDSLKLDNSFDINLSTGTILLRSSENGVQVTAKPEVSMSMPQWSNFSAGVSSNLSMQQEQGFGVKDTSVNLKVDVIGPGNKERQLSLEKAQRSILEAKRNLQAQGLKAETQFYTEIKSLVNDTYSYLQSQQSLYDDTLSFEEVKARGYAEISSTYKIAEMKLLTDQHNIEQKRRKLVRDFVSFYRECGITLEIPEDADLLEYLPVEIPSLEMVNFSDFDKQKYSRLESLNWNHYVNSTSRSINKNITLGVNGGYTFANSSTSSDTVDAGVSAGIKGVKLNAGVNIPVASESKTPSVSFGASFNPNSFKKADITKQQNNLDNELEELAIAGAEKDYEEALIQYEQQKSDILWNRESYINSYNTYSQIEQDMKKWFNMGIINESGYLSAKSNAQSYKVKLIENQLDTIIYNNTVRGLFVQD